MRLEEGRARDKQTQELLAAELQGEAQAAAAARKELGDVRQELAAALEASAGPWTVFHFLTTLEGKMVCDDSEYLLIHGGRGGVT